MHVHTTTGDRPYGRPVMKFTLTYEGSLPSSGNKPKNRDKWNIRKVLHPQFIDLWKSHPALIEIELNGRYFPKQGGATFFQTHHSAPGPISARQPPGPPQDILDLCESINKHGAWFRPLVRETFALHCGLNVHFLRKEPPGRVYQGGDLDGRIKTLIDALTMPQHVEQVLEKTTTKIEPLYCLLEDDSMISGLESESERLLGDNPIIPDFVKLMIEVDVRIRRPMIYNQSFLS
jgi:hypothetical protein